MVEKHPESPSDCCFIPDPQPTVAVEMTEEEVIRLDQQEDLTGSDRNTSWGQLAAESPDQNSVQASSTACCTATFIRK